MMSQVGSAGADPPPERSATLGPVRALPVAIMSAMLTYFVFMLQKPDDRRKDRAVTRTLCTHSGQVDPLATHTGCYRVTQSMEWARKMRHHGGRGAATRRRRRLWLRSPMTALKGSFGTTESSCPGTRPTSTS